MIDQKTQDRIDKLERLSASPNKHEAALAKERAEELIAKAAGRKVARQPLSALDVETHPIKPGCPAPTLVCVSTSDHTGEDLHLRQEGLRVARELLVSGEIVGHWVFFDLCVLAAEDATLLPLIFKAIDEGRVHCTQVRQMIIDNAEGRLKFEWNEEIGEFKKQSYQLFRLVMRHLDINIESKKKGDDIWRLRYNELEDVPLVKWPTAATNYAIDDSIYTRQIFYKQEEYCAPRGLPGGRQGEISQTQAAWGLTLMSAHGVRTDPQAVAKLKKEVTAEYRAAVECAQKWGFVRKGIKESRNMAAIKDAAKDWYTTRSLPMIFTDGGKKGRPQVSTNREQLTSVKCECGFGFQGCNCIDTQSTNDWTASPGTGGTHRGLWAVAEVVRLQKLLKTYICALERGTVVPLNPRYNPIIETFRTSCSQGMKIDGVPMGTNLQNPPRKHGVRECFIPRLGWMFVFCDYDTLEMLTLAQVCYELFGYSYILEAALRGEDFHLSLAADMMEISYEEAKRRIEDGDELMIDMRQGCKIGNYGFAGGMSWRTFIVYAKGFGKIITPKLAKALHAGFRRKWKEMGDYFKFISNLMGDGNRAKVIQFPKSQLMRGKVTYCQAANGFFQHRAAMGAKAAVYEVSKKCYIKPESKLYGCRPWLFSHDEIGAEIPYTGKRASDAAKDLESTMVDAMKSWCPDVPISATAVITRRWYKGAKPLVRNGVLLPCKPEGKPVKWVHDAAT